MYEKGQARSRIDHKNGGSSGISLFTAIYISQVISGLIWTYLDLSGLDWTGLESVKKTIFKKSQVIKVIRNLTSTKLIKETSDLLKKQIFVHKEEEDK